MLDNFQRLLQQGCIFQVPEKGDWVLYDENDNEISRGVTLEQMISRAPGSTHTTFSEIELNANFMYLDEKYLKCSPTSALSAAGSWNFLGHEEVIKV